MSYRIAGWIPDLPDHRDRKYSELRPQSRLLKALASPKAVYLHADNLPRVYNQGNLGSCVGHGVGEHCAYTLDYLYERTDGKQPGDLSRLFAYYIARQHKDQDEGAYIRDGVKAIAKYGICDEKYWPYDERRWAQMPSKEAFDNAATRSKAVEYFRLETVSDIIDCLAQGFPVVYGMVLFDSFMLVGKDGEVSMPTKRERPVGGHCMLIIGYSKKKKAFYVRNSWGPDWGNNGNCWVPFQYIQEYADDFWTIRKLSK